MQHGELQGTKLHVINKWLMKGLMFHARIMCYTFENNHIHDKEAFLGELNGIVLSHFARAQLTRFAKHIYEIRHDFLYFP